MKQRCLPVWWLGICLFAAVFRMEAVSAQTLTIDAQLIWATSDPQSPDLGQKPLEPKLAARLSRASGYHWRYFYLINQQVVTVPEGVIVAVPMSARCRLEVRNLGADRSEIKLFGRGKPVSRHVETLTRGHLLVMGGNAENETAWLVAIRKVEPKAP